MSTETESVWDRLKASRGPYPPQAFVFVQEGLRYTADRLHGDNDPCADRHVSGQQLSLGLRDYAIEQYGLLARTVLESWSVRRSEDFGRMVFAMVEAGLLRKTEEDSIEDFTGVFDFDESFGDELERCEAG